MGATPTTGSEAQNTSERQRRMPALPLGLPPISHQAAHCGEALMNSEQAARRIAADLEDLDLQQVEESERQPWTPAYRTRVIEIIARHIRQSI
jgi:hypothetical protein